MKRYAQLLYGKVIEIREAENLGQLAYVFGPENYWVDVTDLDCEIGYVAKYVDGAGVMYVDPNKVQDTYTPRTLDEAKELKIKKFRIKFVEERDKIRFIEVKQGVTYGFDCTSEDITNFLAAFIPLLKTESGSTLYKVWLAEDTKGIATLTYEEMQHVYDSVRTSQFEAYTKYETKKELINQAQNVEELKAIKWDPSDPDDDFGDLIE